MTLKRTFCSPNITPLSENSKYKWNSKTFKQDLNLSVRLQEPHYPKLLAQLKAILIKILNTWLNLKCHSEWLVQNSIDLKCTHLWWHLRRKCPRSCLLDLKRKLNTQLKTNFCITLTILSWKSDSKISLNSTLTNFLLSLKSTLKINMKSLMACFTCSKEKRKCDRLNKLRETARPYTKLKRKKRDANKV